MLFSLSRKIPAVKKGIARGAELTYKKSSLDYSACLLVGVFDSTPTFVGQSFEQLSPAGLGR